MGQAVCSRFMQLGYRVAAILPFEVSECRRAEMDARPLHEVRCDMQDIARIHRSMEAVEEAIGQIEIIVADADVSYDLIDACGERMAERGWGRVIDIAASVRRDADRQAGASAQDQRRLERAKALALRLESRGVTVNTISPSHIGASSHVEQVAQQGMSARLSLAEEIAGLAAYLASNEAGFLTGVNIAVNGGRRLA
jgi:NAD(P)-dependent dehydrogenase (short-subunit alcohol dehydrogenase family)